MAKRRFNVTLTGYAYIELDDDVIDVVDEEWRGCFYNLHSAEQIAQHIAYNLIVNEVPLSILDGWADQPDSNARILEFVDWDVDAEEEYA